MSRKLQIPALSGDRAFPTSALILTIDWGRLRLRKRKYLPRTRRAFAETGVNIFCRCWIVPCKSRGIEMSESRSLHAEIKVFRETEHAAPASTALTIASDNGNEIQRISRSPRRCKDTPRYRIVPYRASASPTPRGGDRKKRGKKRKGGEGGHSGVKRRGAVRDGDV